VKGIELPINILVIIAVAVIVLLGIIALYFSGFVGPAGTMTSEGSKVKYCGVIMKNVAGCSTVDPASVTISDYDANKDGILVAGIRVAAGVCPVAATDDNFEMLARCYYGATDKATARKVCGCTG